MADRLARPLAVAWVSTGETGARNYDEFNSAEEIAEVVRGRPSSILTVDMPHCAPEDLAAGRSFADVLPETPARLQRLKDEGRFTRHEDVVLPYRISAPAHTAYGVWVMVPTAEISAAAGEPGRVIRNEEVFPAKVRERLALTQTLGHLISAVLLVQAGDGAELVAAIAAWCDAHEPASRDVDDHGQAHEVWLMGPGPERERLLGLLDTAELVVADGNHRSLAAQEARLPEFLAVVTAPESVVIRPYNRLLRALPAQLPDLPAALTAAGFDVREVDPAAVQPAGAGRIGLYLGERGAYDVGLPAPAPDAAVVDRLDHTVVERALLNGVLGMDAGDERIAYVGGDYGPDWLRAEVDAGRAVAAILIAPVTTEDFIEVNAQRMTMPRKSTWFTPKARAGLVLAEL